MACSCGYRFGVQVHSSLFALLPKAPAYCTRGTLCWPSGPQAAQQLLTASRDGTLRTWDLAGCTSATERSDMQPSSELELRLMQLGAPPDTRCTALAGSGEHVVCGTSSGEVLHVSMVCCALDRMF